MSDDEYADDDDFAPEDDAVSPKVAVTIPAEGSAIDEVLGSSLSPRYDDSFLSESPVSTGSVGSDRRQPLPAPTTQAAAAAAQAISPRSGYEDEWAFDKSFSPRSSSLSSTSPAAPAPHPSVFLSTSPSSSATSPLRQGEPSPSPLYNSSSSHNSNATPDVRSSTSFPDPSPTDVGYFGDSPGAPNQPNFTPQAAMVRSTAFFPPSPVTSNESFDAAMSSMVSPTNASPSTFNMTPPAAASMRFFARPAAHDLERVPESSPSDVSHFGGGSSDSPPDVTPLTSLSTAPTSDISHDYSVGFETVATLAKESGITLTKIRDPAERPKTVGRRGQREMVHEEEEVLQTPPSPPAAVLPYSQHRDLVDEESFQDWEETPTPLAVSHTYDQTVAASAAPLEQSSAPQSFVPPSVRVSDGFDDSRDFAGDESFLDRSTEDARRKSAAQDLSPTAQGSSRPVSATSPRQGRASASHSNVASPARQSRVISPAASPTGLVAERAAELALASPPLEAEPPLTVKHQDHSEAPADMWQLRSILSPHTEEVLHEDAAHAVAVAASVSPTSRPLSSHSRPASRPTTATSHAAAAAATPPLGAADPVPIPVAPVVVLPPRAGVSPRSPLREILISNAAHLANFTLRAQERDQQLDAKAQRDTNARHAIELNKPHRSTILAQLPDLHFAPVPTRSANVPRFIQADRAAPVWTSSHTPAAVIEHNAAKALHPRTAIPSLEYAASSERYQTASSRFAAFLKKEPSVAVANTARQREPSRFSAMDAAMRDEPQPAYGSELLHHSLSHRARGHIKRATPALGHADINPRLLPTRHRSGAHETPRSVVEHPYLSKYTAALAQPSRSSAPLSSAPRRSHTLASATAAPVGAGIARLQQHACSQQQRVYLLKLAYRDRERAQEAVRNTLIDAANNAQDIVEYEGEVRAVHAALIRREAADRERMRRGEDEDLAPPTREEDAGFFSAFEREAASRRAFERARQRGEIITPALEARILARGADAESEVGDLDPERDSALNALDEPETYLFDHQYAFPSSLGTASAIYGFPSSDELEQKYDASASFGHAPEEGEVPMTHAGEWSPGRVPLR